MSCKFTSKFDKSVYACNTIGHLTIIGPSTPWLIVVSDYGNIILEVAARRIAIRVRHQSARTHGDGARPSSHTPS